MGKGPEQTFLQRKYTNGQQAHEKMFNKISNASEFQIQMQIKTTIRYHFIPKGNEKKNSKCW